jgi:hypothetical protein
MIGIGIAIVLSLKRILDDGSPYVLTDYVATDYVEAAP